MKAEIPIVNCFGKKETVMTPYAKNGDLYVPMAVSDSVINPILIYLRIPHKILMDAINEVEE